MRTLYLDYNATTPIAPVVQEAMLPFLSEHYGNPSSNHSLGRASFEAVAYARENIAELLGCSTEEIFFTSGGSESNNLAIKGITLRKFPHTRGHVVISAVEHPSVSEPAHYLQRLGFEVSVVKCDRTGLIKVDEFQAALRPNTCLTSVIHANNEIGTVQPIRALADLCQQREIPFHTDASQSVGKLPVSVDELGVDLLTIAGHKMYAPKGVGVLFVRRGIALEPLIHGGGQEGGLRSGTENVSHIVGLGRAAQLILSHQSELAPRLMLLRDRLESQLAEGLGPGMTTNGHPQQRLPNTLSINFPDVSGAELLRRIPELLASTGSACHSSQHSLSTTLTAIGLDAEIAQGTVRLSVGWFTTEEEVDRAANLLLTTWENMI